MKTSILVILLFLSTQVLLAQNTCDCNADLEFVKAQLVKTPSFKDQLKGEGESGFNDMLLSLRSDEDLPAYECFWRLNKLVGLLKDNHTVLVYQPSENINPFKGLKAEVPESLSTRLASMPLQNIEGIYSLSDKIEIGLYRTEVKDSLVGVVLKSKENLWSKGEVCMILKETANSNQFDMLMSFDKHKMYYRKNFLLQEGALFSNLFKLSSKAENQAVLSPDVEPYTFHQMGEAHYVWFDSFRSSQENWEKKNQFLQGLAATELKSNVIIDLRNNGGGSDKISRDIFKALKKKAKGLEVMVMTNFYSASNAELFTLKAKRKMDATHIGWRTNGTLSYGVNYGTTHELPSGKFMIRPTDMDLSKNLQYEVLGIEPDVILDYWVDWRQQLKTAIKLAQ